MNTDSTPCADLRHSCIRMTKEYQRLSEHETGPYRQNSSHGDEIRQKNDTEATAGLLLNKIQSRRRRSLPLPNEIGNFYRNIPLEGQDLSQLRVRASSPSRTTHVPDFKPESEITPKYQPEGIVGEAAGSNRSREADEDHETPEALVRQLRAERESKLREATLEINESSEKDDSESDDSDDLLFCRMKNISSKPPVQFDTDDDTDDWNPQDNDHDPSIEAKTLETITDDSFVESPQADTMTPKVQGTARQARRKISTKPSRKEHEISKEIGLQRLIGISKLTDKLYLHGKLNLTALRQGDEVTQKSRKGSTTRLSEQELQSLFVHSDIIKGAGTNSTLPSAPGFTSKNRKVALEEMVASIPIELKAEARSDKRMIDEAIKKFDHKPRSDGQGGWKVKGMKISLYHHQVMAVGWMRDRERSHTPPQGGLLCDVMGLGKTVTALTTILDGRCIDEGEKRAPTLIVVPSQLSEYWVQQIRKHYDPSVFGAFYKYEAKSSSGFAYNPKGILFYDAVIATFEDIRRSYPKPEASKELGSHEEKTQWWSNLYDTEVGIFHRIKWQRIVLDEAHYIKNPDSHTSIAVKALHGRYKWVLSGTSLHNCVEEMFPYFNFLGVPNSFLFCMFKRSYCNHDASKSQASKNRLINILRSILHRKTHESRLMGRPLVELPNITERHIEVDLCGVETLIYEKIINIFIEKINSLSGDASTQWKCILTMFLKLRMFISYVLTAQDIVQYSLKQNDTLMAGLKSEATGDPADDSARIVHAFSVVMNRNMVSETSLRTRDERLVSASALGGDHRKLSRDFDTFMKQLHDKGNWTERWRRLRCAQCKFPPTSGSILTSCLHLYCEECFNFLLDTTATETGSEKQNLTCHSCTKVITAAAYCDIFDRFNGSNLSPAESPSRPVSTSRKRKRGGQVSPESEPSSQAMKRIVKKPSRSSKNFKNKYGIFHSTGQDDTDSFEDEDSQSSTYTEDWIPIIGNQVPGAKLTETRILIRSFIESDPTVKIVVFTQFIDTTRLLEQICKEETWDYTKMTGRMPIAARNESISKFRENPDVKIMIASLKTGGVGLDLSVANKCIMIDLWWNEAIEEQAYCRLFRIGQKREVEYVKIIAKKTFDERLLDMQKDKTKRIREVISPEVLDSRNTDKQLLEWFGEIQQVKGGGFKILSSRPEKSGDNENDPIIMD